jgi:hypothetical protein
MSTEAHQKGKSTQDPSTKTMASRTFDVKFCCGTQLTFGSLIFAAGENGELKLLPPGPAPGHLAPMSSSASGRSCVGPSHCAGSYIRTAKIIWGIPVVMSTLRPLVGASGSFILASTPNSYLADDYPEIGARACGEPMKDDHFIYMVVPNDDRLSNTSSRYATIRRLEASDARTLTSGLAQNLNPDFNAVRVQTIMETIQHMTPDGSPLAVLAQQGAEVANLIITEKLADVPQREPSVGGNDQARHARSEAAPSASPNRRAVREYGRERDDLRNVIEDRRHLRRRTPSPPRRSLAEDVASMEKEWIPCSGGTTQASLVPR